MRGMEPWRECYLRIVAGMEAGIVEWKTDHLRELCGLTAKCSEVALTSREHSKAELRFVKYVTLIKEELGGTHRVDLRASRQGTYELVPHDKHIGVAMRDMGLEIQRAVKGASRRISYFDPATSAEATRLAIAEVQIAAVRAQARHVADKRVASEKLRADSAAYAKQKAEEHAEHRKS